MKPVVFVLLGVLVLFQSGSASDPSQSSITETTAPSVFVDRDGDGINDNLRDTDADGIPEPSATPESMDATTPTGSGIFAGTSMSRSVVPLPTANSERFNRLLGRASCISMSRGGFGSDNGFGPGNGIGIGAVAGSACAGGICQ